ncbi:hypothetical protein F511_32924 [Dorcoceras hygrometricum]|uniref:Uncharacterized protein n=1 Tax=Dorcoceras hygrometricum TaxID=472368 RepID=A0A2Z7C186_9LAMI|nr:hypothetical protein F511_32924 [Dorcoceras hygrometricum]
MMRRRAEESADGLALMTSSVTSSQSADACAASLLSSLAAAAAAATSPEICSGQFDVENPIVLISSGLLVQSDEGVPNLVVDRIDESTAINREAPGS